MTNDKPIAWSPTPTKAEMLERIDHLRALLDAHVPDEAHLDLLLQFHSIFVDNDTFVQMFKGEEVNVDDNGTVGIEKWGYRFASLHFIPRSNPFSTTIKIEG